MFVAAIGGTDDTDEATIRRRPRRGAGMWFPTSPLMHVAAQWTVFLAASMGATVVLHDDARRSTPPPSSPPRPERANMMTIIGDAYARPLLEELRPNEYDLSALAVLGTGGAPTSAGAKHALAEMLPGVTIRDGYGASEIGVMGSGDQAGHWRRPSASSSPRRGGAADDRSRFLADDEPRSGGSCARGTSRSATSTTRPRPTRPSRRRGRAGGGRR